MQILAITLSALLAGTCYLLGRSCVITTRLRRTNSREKGRIKKLMDRLENTEDELSGCLAILAILKTPFSPIKRSFRVGKDGDVYHVLMSVDTPKGDQFGVVIKTFHDNDPEFARNEAEEFKSQCEESIS